jgi:hypothetical protein
MGEEVNPLSGADRPRPLPEGLRARLEASLTGAESSDEGALLEGVDRARPIPPAARARIEARLLSVAHGGRRNWVPAIAAALALMVAAAGAIAYVARRTPGPQRGTELDSFAAGEATSDAVTGSGGPPPPYTVEGGPDLTTTAPETAGRAAPSDESLALEAAPMQDAAPPAAASPPPEQNFGASSEAGAGGPPISPPDVLIELSGPESEISQGARAYFDTVNSSGGINGRTVGAVSEAETGGRVEGALAQINTSLDRTIAPDGRRPLLEGPAATDRLLEGQVFSFAAPPERLAYLAVDGLKIGGARAVIFTGDGVFADVVPAAFETALRTQTSRIQRVAAPNGAPSSWPVADVAVLALDADESRAWLDAARQRGYSTRLGLIGIYNLAEPSLAGMIPSGSSVVSPYAEPMPAEAEAMAAFAGGPPSFGFTHGWVTAKAAALALWRSGASTPEEMAAALGSLQGETLNGLIAPYSVRPGTNSRTPEGIFFKVTGEKLVALGGFRGTGRTK